MEIQSILLDSPDLFKEVYGFGSFFSKREFNDIDILGVSHRHSDPIQTHKIFRCFRERIHNLFKVNVDFLIFTEDEFRDRPLRDMDQLVILFPPTD